MKHLPFVIVAALAAAVAATVAIVVSPPMPARLRPPPVAARPLPPGGDFTLASSRGRFALADVRGRVVVLSFGYTSCPDICPTTLATIGAAVRALPPAVAEQVVPVFVTIDPERDLLPKLAAYVTFFHPALIGASGTAAELADVASRYEVSYARVVSEGGYTMDHSAEIHVIDRAGRPAVRLAHDVAPAELVAAIQRVAAARPAPTTAVAVTAHDPYVRLVPAASANTAAFVRLHNPTGRVRAVVAVSSAAARTAELHTHLDDNGVMRMRRVDRIELPAGGEAVLEPGGFHVMLFDLVRPLAAGDVVAIELVLDDGQRLHLDAPVRGGPARTPAAAMGHDHLP